MYTVTRVTILIKGIALEGDEIPRTSPWPAVGCEAIRPVVGGGNDIGPFAQLVQGDPDSGAGGAAGGISDFVRIHPEVHITGVDPGGGTESSGDYGAAGGFPGPGRSRGDTAPAGTESNPTGTCCQEGVPEQEQPGSGRNHRQHPGKHVGRACGHRLVANRWQEEAGAAEQFGARVLCELFGSNPSRGTTGVQRTDVANRERELEAGCCGR